LSALSRTWRTRKITRLTASVNAREAKRRDHSVSPAKFQATVDPVRAIGASAIFLSSSAIDEKARRSAVEERFISSDIPIV
jgi:hypothetical protein